MIERVRLLATAPALALVLGLSCVTLPVPVRAQSAPQLRGLPDFTELVSQVGPSVVNIRTTSKRKATTAQDEQMQEFFRRFFGAPMPDKPGGGAEPVRGLGSGFI